MSQLIQHEDLVEQLKKDLDTTGLPAASRFRSGPFVHVYFDGGSADGVGTGGFTIVGPAGNELIQAGRFFGDSYTKNKPKALAIIEALNCLDKLRKQHPELDLPVLVQGDSQLIINNLVGIYKKPSKIRVYQAIKQAIELTQELSYTTYCYIEQGFNAVPEVMARQALASWADIICMPGQVPDDAPKQQVSSIYENVKNTQAVLQELEEYYRADWERILSKLELGESVVEGRVPLKEALELEQRRGVIGALEA